MMRKIHPRHPVVVVWLLGHVVAQQWAAEVATHSAGCSLLGLWPIPALLQFLRPGRERQLLRQRLGWVMHVSCEAAASHHLNCNHQSTLTF